MVLRRSLLAVAATLLLPAAASAQIAIQSAHEATLRVEGDARGYARVTAQRPMTFEVAGPGTLTIVLRQELDADQTVGRTTTEVSMLRAGRSIESLRLRGRSPGRYAAGGPLRPTEAVERRLEVGEGVVRFAIRVDSRGHQIVASVGFEPEDDMDLVPLVPLATGARASADDDDGEIPLASLTPDDDEPELPVVALVPQRTDDDERAGDGETVAVARVHPPVDGDPGVGATARPPGGEPGTTRTARLVLGMRGLAAHTGMGGGALGGGVDLMLRTGMMDDRLAFGVSADLVPYQLVLNLTGADGSLRQRRYSVQAIPVMAAAGYVLPGAGPLKVQVIGGVGPVFASAADGRASNRTILLGGAIAAGPLLEVGPGAASVAVRASGSFGRIADQNGQTVMRGPLGGVGLTFGYVLTL